MRCLYEGGEEEHQLERLRVQRRGRTRENGSGARGGDQGQQTNEDEEAS